MKRIFYHIRRRPFCRKKVHIYSFLFSLLLLTAPFVVFGDERKMTEVSGGFFGLHPDLIKLAFFLLFSFAIWLLNRAIAENTKSQNMLYANQRELTRALTQLVTAHNINHCQEIEAPKLVGE